MGGAGSGALRREFQSWAAGGGGQYFDAAVAEQLGRALEEALRPGFSVLDNRGQVVAQGKVAGGSVEVPVGLYTVQVGLDPPRTSRRRRWRRGQRPS